MTRSKRAKLAEEPKQKKAGGQKRKTTATKTTSKKTTTTTTNKVRATACERDSRGMLWLCFQ